MKIISGLLFVVFVLVACSHKPSKEFDVSPLIHQLAPSTGVESTTFVVSNPGDRPLPLEFTPRKLLMRSSGAIPGGAADDALLVFPSSVLLAPGEVQTVTVEWDSEVLLDTDQSFFVIVDQVGDKSSESSFDRVQMLLSYNVVVHVKAHGSKVAMVTKFAQIDEHSSSSVAHVSIENTGTANAFGSRMSLSVSSPDRQVEYSSAQLQAKYDDLFFPPEHRRTLKVLLPEGHWREPVHVKVGYDGSF